MALSTTQYGYIIDPMVPFTDGKGKTIKNGFVRVFVAGSSTPVVTYRNFDGAANQDLIELDNSGRTKTSVIGSKGLTYKVCVYDKHHSQESPILTVDKVSVIGANITAGAGSTLVTGLDGLTTKPDGFVDASVVGTNGYVALDHTLVTDDLDTDAKVTAVEENRYIPLLNEDVNDPDSKMTPGRLWQWVFGKIKSLSTTITAFRSDDVIPVDGPSGTAKMSKDDLLNETAENAADSGLMPKNETDTNFDFSIVDGQGNAIIIIKDGTILSKNFDSSLMKTKESKDGQQYFEVCDTNGNCIFAVSTDGTILSKNFDSSLMKAKESKDGQQYFEICDTNGNCIFAVSTDGTILSKNFDSSKITYTYVKDDTDGFRIVDYKGNCVLSVNGGNLVSANFDSRMNDYKRSPNYGKSIATFGGSHSVYPESYGMKEYWKALLGMSVTDYGVGGNGYSSLQTPEHNVQEQVDGAMVHDIYLLVCSTNDFTYSREIGEYNDYSFGDGYDSSKLVTMCGGINYAIRKIYEKNPNAKICGFLGLPFFTRYAGYNEFSKDFNSLGKNYFDYISAFAKTMNWNHLPVLDLFHNCGFNVHNKSLFYQNDNLHLTFMGYNRLAMMTTDFISKL